MTRIVGRPTAAVLCLLLGQTAFAADDARAVIDRAIRATAGTTLRLDKMGTTVQKMKGTLVSGGGRIPATWESWAVLPDQFKFRIEMNFGGEVRPIEMVLNDPRGWRRAALTGELAALGSSEIRELADEAYAHWVASLVPLRKSGFELTTIKSEKVNGADAAGVRVSRRGRPDVELFFDRKTDLLVQVTFRAKEAGVAVGKKWVYSKHRQFDGLTLPGEVAISYDGRPVAEWEVTGYEFPSRLDKNVFERPE